MPIPPAAVEALIAAMAIASSEHTPTTGSDHAAPTASAEAMPTRRPV